MLVYLDDILIPDKEKLVAFAFKMYCLRNDDPKKLYDIEFQIEPFSCTSYEDAQCKPSKLKYASINVRNHRPNTVGREKAFNEFLSLVGCINLTDKTTKNRIQIEYYSSINAHRGNARLVILDAAEIKNGRDPVYSNSQKEYLDYFYKKINYDPNNEITEDKHYTQFATAGALGKIPSVLGMHIGTFLSRGDGGAALARTCHAAANTAKNQNKKKKSINSLFSMFHRGTTQYSVETSQNKTKKCSIM